MWRRPRPEPSSDSVRRNGQGVTPLGPERPTLDHPMEARFRRSIQWAVLGYLLLLGLSRAVRVVNHVRRSAGEDGRLAAIHEVKSGVITDRIIRLAYRDYSSSSASSVAPVLLIHGSPGRKEELHAVARILATSFRVIVPDLPGFGGSDHNLPDYSFRAHALYVEQLLEALDVPRVHVVGFSMGGGVALSLTQIAQERLASLTMLSAIGVQEMELTGDYYANHAVHAVQLAAIWLVGEGIPHMGALDDAMLGVPYARNFFDSDQRPLRDVLRHVIIPTLIVHGVDDGQVPIEAAREHARLVPQSELVTLPRNHFLVFTRAGTIAELVGGFITRVEHEAAADRASASPSRIRAALQRVPSDRLPRARGIAGVVFFALVTTTSLVLPTFGSAVAGTLVADGRVAIATASVACLIGIVVGQVIRRLTKTQSTRAAISGMASTLVRASFSAAIAVAVSSTVNIFVKAPYVVAVFAIALSVIGPALLGASLAAPSWRSILVAAQDGCEREGAQR
jgi:pimeloyl-ACP methyl ester carboxylesterase